MQSVGQRLHRHHKQEENPALGEKGKKKKVGAQFNVNMYYRTHKK